MASEFWIVVDKNDQPRRDLVATSEGLAASIARLSDEREPDLAPHRVVHLVEVDGPNIDPKVEAVVQRLSPLFRKTPERGRAAWKALSVVGRFADVVNSLEEAYRELTPAQLRACGVEVDDGKWNETRI